MRIVVYADGSETLVKSAIDRALRALKAARVDTDGGGLIGSAEKWKGGILLRNDSDLARALEILSLANIKTSE